MATKKKKCGHRYLVVPIDRATEGRKGNARHVAEHIWEQLEDQGMEDLAYNDEWLVGFIETEMAIYRLDTELTVTLTSDEVVSEILPSLWDIRSELMEETLGPIDEFVRLARTEHGINLHTLRNVSLEISEHLRRKS